PPRAPLRPPPHPSPPAPPMIATAMGARAYLAPPPDVVDLLVQGGPRHGSAFVLEPLPQGLGPFPDGRPHPPEVLLRHLGEVAVGLGGRELVRRVLQHEHRGGEPVLDLVVHGRSLLRRSMARSDGLAKP